MRILLVLLALVVPLLAAAQTNPRLASLSIEIWPEYDRPAALVILRGVLAEGVKLPAAVAMRVPAASEGATAVAYSTSAEGNLLNLRNEQTRAGDYVTVKFEAPERFFHLEFYEPIATGSAARSFRYTWPGDFAVDRATIAVQEPAAASGIAVDPQLTQTSTGQGGLTYRIGDLGALPAGKPVTVKIDYSKADARPTTEIKGLRTAQPAPSAPSAPSAPAPVPDVASAMPAWVVPMSALAGLSFLVALAILMLWRRQGRARAAGYCRRCGAALAADSNFCAKCGTKVESAASRV